MKQRCTKVTTLLLTLSMLLALTACGSSNANSSAENAATAAPIPTESAAAPAPASTPEPISESAYPMTVTDALGREVTFEEQPVTVAITWRMANDFIQVLDLGDRVVCVGPTTDFDFIVSPEWEAIAGIAGRGPSPDWEAMAKINPDIYINTTNSETAEAGDELGIKVLAISAETAEETLDTILTLGKILGVEERAQMLCDLYTDISAIPADLLGDAAEEDLPTFVMLRGADAVATPSMMQAQLISDAGARNAAAEIDSDALWPVVGTEQIFEWDPEYIFMGTWSELKAEDIMADPAWADMQAVKNGHVYDVPYKLQEWDGLGMTPCLATVWAFMQMHPELYTQEELDDLVVSFYDIVYHMDVNREMLGY